MYQIPTGAIARLVMVNGSLVSEAEVAQILESYSYQQDSNNPNRWVLMDGPADGNAALVFSNEGEIIDVYSDSDENILNLNYIAMRIGWSDCEIYTINQEVEDKLLVRLVNVGIANQSTAAGTAAPEPAPHAATPPRAPVPPVATPEVMPIAPPPAVPTAAPAASSEIESMNEDYLLLQQLRVKLAEAEQRSEELAEDKHRLEARVRQLESISAATTAAPARIGEERPNDDSGLVRIVEKHLLSLLDLSAVDKSGLMTELKQHGYRVDVKLVRS